MGSGRRGRECRRSGPISRGDAARVEIADPAAPGAGALVYGGGWRYPPGPARTAPSRSGQVAWM